MPEVGLALDAFYLASGATNTGIGIDDKLHGKPTGNQRIIFGLFNAATVALPHVLAKLPGSGGFKPGESPRPPTEEPTPPVTGNAPVETEINSQLSSLFSSESIQAKFKPFASKYKTSGGFQPNAWGAYKIKGEYYIPIKGDGSNGNVLYKARITNEGDIELVKPGESISKNAPRLHKFKNGDFREVINQSEFAKIIKNATNTRPLREAYEKGLASGDPTTIKGYKKSLAYDQIQALIMQPERTSEEIGTLVAVLKKREVTVGLKDFLVFKGDVEAAGGSAVGIPQNLYLHESTILNKGECAALSTVMALAIQNNKEDVFIENLFKATVSSKNPTIIKFRKNMNTLQENLKNSYVFHGQQVVNPVPHTNIMSELNSATTTKILRITDNSHAFITGVIIKNGKKSFFFYDPNYGMAKFPTSEAMEKGLDSLLKSGHTASSRNPYGNDPGTPEYMISEFRETDFRQVAPGANPHEFFNAPL